MRYSDLYLELKVIGRGNFGTVHLVKSLRDNERYVAKKVLVAGMCPEQLKSTYREVAVLQKLKHPHIVQYIESFTEDDMLIIVMEHCDSGDLSRRVAAARDRSAPLTEELILHWLLQCALALEYIHESRILHRDIKCSNIFLTRMNTVKLGDFGISRVLEHTNSLALTMVGTPYYMSPEVCENRPYDNKSDVWSLGCVAYELCSLGYPFKSANLLGLIVKIAKEEPAPLSEEYSPALRSMISAMLKKNADERPSIPQLLQMPALSSYILGLELPKERPRSEETLRQRMLRVKADLDQAEAELSRTPGKNSWKGKAASRLGSQDLVYGEFSDLSGLRTDDAKLNVPAVASQEHTSLTPTYDAREHADSSDSFELSSSLASEDFTLSKSRKAEDRPIKSSGFYDIDRVLSSTIEADTDSDDEPYEDLQSQTVAYNPQKSEDEDQPVKFSNDNSSYEARVAWLRSECLAKLGETRFTEFYEFIRRHHQVSSKDSEILREAQSRYGKQVLSSIFCVERLVFLEDEAW